MPQLGVTRCLTLFRRGRITLEEADRQLEVANRETAEARLLLDSLSAQAELLKAWEARVVEIAVLLQSLQEQLEEVERTNDWDKKRQIVALLVPKIVVHTEGQGHRKRAAITRYYAFGKPRRLDTIGRVAEKFVTVAQMATLTRSITR